jgi:hypothetical protein
LHSWKSSPLALRPQRAWLNNARGARRDKMPIVNRCHSGKLSNYRVVTADAARPAEEALAGFLAAITVLLREGWRSIAE